MSEYLLTTQDLTKTYGRHNAIDHVSMHIPKGAVYGFIGRNGAGKTTLMKIIAGLSTQTSGSYELFGCSGAQMGAVREKIGCLIEAPGIYPDMTAFQNVKAKCLVRGVYNVGYVNELLQAVGLFDAGKKKAKDFSLGMRQRLGIAIALVGDPEFMVLDEPINGLDPQGIVEVRETIHRLALERHITILISSHILDELAKIATHIGIIENGVLLKELSAQQLKDECAAKIEIVVDNAAAAMNVLQNMGITQFQQVNANQINVTERIDESAAVNKALVEAGIAVSKLNVSGEALEDYYIRITGGAR